MFDLDVVNAFSKGTVIILKSYFNSKVLKGDVRIYRNANHVGGVIVFIGITGDLSGRLMFNMSKSTAFKLASALNSESITIIDDIFVSTIKEFVNMVAGSAINDLYTKHIDKMVENLDGKYRLYDNLETVEDAIDKGIIWKGGLGGIPLQCKIYVLFNLATLYTLRIIASIAIFLINPRYYSKKVQTLLLK